MHSPHLQHDSTESVTRLQCRFCQRIVGLTVAVALALILAAGCGGDPEKGGTAPSTVPATPFSDGTHAVGVDIAPGTYRAPAGIDCYWFRLSGFGGTVDDVEAAGGSGSSEIVTILPSDAGFQSDGCGQWTPLRDVEGDRATSFGDGTFRVGIDIAAGTYRARGGGGCTWERLSGFTGPADAIEVGGFEPNVTVTISSTDAGFRSNRCGRWTRR